MPRIAEEVKSKEEPKNKLKETNKSMPIAQQKTSVKKIESKKNQVQDESQMNAVKQEISVIDSVVRVNVKVLDKIMNVVGELVLNRNQIVQFANSHEQSELNRLTQQLSIITTELQNDIMTTRMQPVGNVLSKFERVIRDLARKQNKKIKLIIKGEKTELDKTLLEAIKDPLTHLIRNAVDHGIESPEERVIANKPEEGIVMITSYHEGGQVTIEIKDDGGGINSVKVLEKAISKGIVTTEEAERMSEKQIINMIFSPGFSTAAEVTEISGRGVGMDVVKTNVEKIGGMVDIESEFGVGSTFKMKIPLTLAIIPALVVESDLESFAIPQINLVELVRIEDQNISTKIEKLHDSEFFRLRGELIPIFRINEVLDLKNVHEKTMALTKNLEDLNVESSFKNKNKNKNENVQSGINIVILNAEGKTYGLIVDKILDTQEIVVKPLSGALKHINIFAGATIMGNGHVALIIDARNDLAVSFNVFSTSIKAIGSSPYRIKGISPLISILSAENSSRRFTWPRGMP